MAQFNENELTQIGAASVLTGFVIAKADRDAGETSLAAAIAEKKDLGSTPPMLKSVYEEKFSGNALIGQVLKHLYFLYNGDDHKITDREKDFYVALHPKNKNWQLKFIELNDLLKRAPASEAMEYKKFLITVGKSIAKQSGAGDMGLEGDKSVHEKKRLEEIVKLLS